MSAKSLGNADVEQQRISGAKACVPALRKLVQSAENSDIGPTAADYYGLNIKDAQVFVADINKAVGPLTSAQEGVIAVLVEYIHDSITSGDPDLERGWQSMAAMTDAELHKMVKSMQDDMEADNERMAKLRAEGNVIRFPGIRSHHEAKL